jgi:hypothetical protein
MPTVTVTTQVPTVPPIVLPSSSPSVTDWLGGIGTAGALILLAVGLLWEVRNRRKDDERRAAERRDNQRAQARLVHLRTRTPDPQDPFMVEFVIFNDSQGAVHDVRPVIKTVPVDGLRKVEITGTTELSDDNLLTEKGALMHLRQHADERISLRVHLKVNGAAPSQRARSRGHSVTVGDRVVRLDYVVIGWGSDPATRANVRCGIDYLDMHGR